MIESAVIDSTEKYRYLLTRIWDEDLPLAVFIMLNPSTADAEHDDPTIRRCIGFAKDWGYGGIKVVNVFAYRATNPKELLNVIDPIGPDNYKYIKNAVANAGIVIAAWGATSVKNRQAYKDAINTIKNAGIEKIFCLGTTYSGCPRHPLYVRGDTKPEWEVQNG